MLFDASGCGTNRISGAMTYVFRNNTIEQFLGSGYQFSGYDDIVVPQADEYLWWYQVPIHFDNLRLAEEVRMYAQKLQFVIEQISNKTIYVFTLDATGVRTIEASDTNVVTAINEFNEVVYNAASKKSNVKVLRISEFLRQYAEKDLFDYRYCLTAQMPYNPQLIRPFQSWWNRKKAEIAQQRKKCLILDLDNTLWGGILGEDGVDGILLSGSYPGKAFHLWQEGLKELQKSGVMLAICSKNNISDVEEVWTNRDDMLLQKSDFVAMRINWQDKATNIRELSDELNIGLDSMVFVDDNPTERELIKQQLPEIAVPDFPSQPYGLMGLYKDLITNCFGVYRVTQEDRAKTEQYKANTQRRQQQAAFTNMEDYLQSLEMKLRIEKVSDATLQRVAQLTQKTNQFNLTTRRYTEVDIRQMLEEGADVWTLTVADKFGDYGLTGALIIKNNNIDTFLLSCRVLGKGVENAFLLSVLKQYNGEIRAEYSPTLKNTQVADLYDRLGFTKHAESDEKKNYIAYISQMDLSVKPYFEIEIN